MTASVLEVSCGCVQAHDHAELCEWHETLFARWLGHYGDRGPLDVTCTHCEDAEDFAIVRSIDEQERYRSTLVPHRELIPELEAEA